jgi:glycine cleavage system H protein
MVPAGHCVFPFWKRLRPGLDHALLAGGNYPWALARESGAAPEDCQPPGRASGDTLTLAEKDIYCAGLVPIAYHGGTMSEIPEGFLYTEEHEYLKPTDEEGVFLVGVTDYAQGELGDVVYIELPEVGSTYEKMDPFGNIEAVKAVSDLYCPVAGEILDVNAGLADDPAVVNSDPYGEGWIIKIRTRNPDQVAGLMDAAAYTSLVGG